jgi:hypothetical protein
MLLLGESLIAPRQHKIQASASDQARVHEYSHYETHPRYQLPTIRAPSSPSTKLPVPQGTFTTPSIVIANNVPYFLPYAQCYSEDVASSELGTRM